MKKEEKFQWSRKHHYIVLFFLLLLFYAPTFFFKKFYSLHIFVIFLLLYIASCSTPLFWIALVFVAVSELVYSHVMHHWGGALDARIDVAIASPLHETKEYLLNFIEPFDIYLLLYILLFLFLIYFVQKRVRIGKKVHCHKVILFVVVALFIIVGKNIPPLKLYKVIWRGEQRVALLNERATNIKRWNEKHRFEKLESAYRTLLIIIGESAEKHHLSIYGYKKETTPFLKSIHPYIFQAIAPSNQTRLSVPLILGDWDVDHWEDFYTTPSLVTLLKQSGYRTYWLSNQRAAGKNDTMSASLAKEADEYYFPNTKLNAATALDSILLKRVDDINFTKGKKAIFIHLLGSHQRYTDRYDKNIVPFPGTDTIDQYDNTIFYTDYIISKLYQRFKEKNFLMLYFSDHGERVSNSRKSFHGFDPPFKEEYDVPFVVYSDKENDYLKTLKTDMVYLDDFSCMIRNILEEKEICRPRQNETVLVLRPGKKVPYNSLNYSSELKDIMQNFESNRLKRLSTKAPL